MSFNLNELAEQIATLNPREQESLLEKVADLNFQHGLEALSRKYRERLEKEGKSHQQAHEVLEELEQIRDAVAAHDYRA